MTDLDPDTGGRGLNRIPYRGDRRTAVGLALQRTPGAYFFGGNFWNTDSRDATLRGRLLKNAILRGTDFSDADLRGTMDQRHDLRRRVHRHVQRIKSDGGLYKASAGWRFFLQWRLVVIAPRVVAHHPQLARRRLLQDHFVELELV